MRKENFMRRYAVAYCSFSEKEVDINIIKAESAFQACVNYLEYYGFYIDPRILSSCKEDIPTLNDRCLLNCVIHATEIL